MWENNKNIGDFLRMLAAVPQMEQWIQVQEIMEHQASI